MEQLQVDLINLPNFTRLTGCSNIAKAYRTPLKPHGLGECLINCQQNIVIISNSPFTMTIIELNTYKDRSINLV